MHWQRYAKCNTQAYIAAVNAQGLCGHNDWRMPTQEELVSLLDYGRTDVTQPMIDPDYFPHTSSSVDFPYWTALGSASGPGRPPYVDFAAGKFGASYGLLFALVRAVRSAP